MGVTIICRPCTQLNISWKMHSLKLEMDLQQFGDESMGIGSQTRLVFSSNNLSDVHCNMFQILDVF